MDGIVERQISRVEWTHVAEMLLEQLPEGEQAQMRTAVEHVALEPSTADVTVVQGAFPGQRPFLAFRATPSYRVFLEKEGDRLIVVDLASEKQLAFFRPDIAYDGNRPSSGESGVSH